MNTDGVFKYFMQCRRNFIIPASIHTVKGDYMLFIDGWSDLGLLLLRLALAWIFIYHGAKKLDGKMGSFMLFIGICETLGGIAMLLGFLTEFAGIGLAIIMLGAIYTKMTKWSTPFTSMTATGWEFDMLLFAVALAFAFLGAGHYSLDAVLGWWP
jgi:putative oxidoreductase